MWIELLLSCLIGITSLWSTSSEILSILLMHSHSSSNNLCKRACGSLLQSSASKRRPTRTWLPAGNVVAAPPLQFVKKNCISSSVSRRHGHAKEIGPPRRIRRWPCAVRASVTGPRAADPPSLLETHMMLGLGCSARQIAGRAGQRRMWQAARARGATIC